MAHATYPNLTEFLDKALYQGAALSFKEAIESWKVCGKEAVKNAVMEIEELLRSPMSDDDLEKYLTEHSEYAISNDPRETFQFILHT